MYMIATRRNGTVQVFTKMTLAHMVRMANYWLNTPPHKHGWVSARIGFVG